MVKRKGLKKNDNESKIELSIPKCVSNKKHVLYFQSLDIPLWINKYVVCSFAFCFLLNDMYCIISLRGC